jgi:hypothetical protein
MRVLLVLEIGKGAPTQPPATSSATLPAPTVDEPTPGTTIRVADRTIPDEWWAEAVDTLRRFDEASFGEDKALAEKIGQWLGGMIRAGSYFTSISHEELLAKVRQKVGPVKPPKVEGLASWEGVGEVTRPASNKRAPDARGNYDDMANRRRVREPLEAGEA